MAFVVEAKALGTAYGVMQSVQNLGLALLYLSVGAVVDARGYLTLELYFLVWLSGKFFLTLIMQGLDIFSFSVALCSSLGLWFVDSSRGRDPGCGGHPTCSSLIDLVSGGILNMTKQQRQERLEELEEKRQ